MRRLMLLLALAPAAPAFAAPVPIANHSFEADFAAPGTFPVGPVTGWQTHDPAGLLANPNNATGVVNPTNSTFFLPGQLPHGNNAALLFVAVGIGAGELAIHQTLSATLQPGTTYTLTVGVGNIASGTGNPPFDVFGFFDLDGFPGYRVELRAAGSVLADDDNTLFGLIPEGEFRTSTVAFTPQPGDPRLGAPLEIWLINLNQQDTPENPGIEVDFDDVRLDASPVPTACNPADLAEALGTLDINDILTFAALFNALDPAADFFPDTMFDINDILIFAEAFNAGCP